MGGRGKEEGAAKQGELRSKRAKKAESTNDEISFGISIGLAQQFMAGTAIVEGSQRMPIYLEKSESLSRQVYPNKNEIDISII